MATGGQTFWQAGEKVSGGMRGLNVLTTAALMASLLAIAFEYGYYSPPLPLAFLQAVQISAIVVFVLDVLGRYLLTERRREFARRRWADLALLILLLAGLAVQFLRRDAGDSGEFLNSYRFIWIVYIAGQAVMRGIRLNLILAHSRVDPARLLLVSFLSVILLGAATLQLPRATPVGESIHALDSLFTATSAMCVTGLVVRPTGSDQMPGLPGRLADESMPDPGFSRFGQIVILVLIQLGGLGIMLFGTIFAVLMGQQLSLRQGMVMQDMLSGGTLGQINRIVRFIFLTTFAFEAVGAMLLYTMYANFDWPTSTKVFYAVFHSVSAFCNAGFSLTADSLVRYHGYWQVHAVVAPLIVIGGLGFPVLLSLREFFGARLARLFRRPASQANMPLPHLTLHAKLVLFVSAILIVAGATLLLVAESPLTAPPEAGRRVGSQTPSEAAKQMAAERAADDDPHQFRRERTGMAIADAVFMSVTARTAGFNTVDMDYRHRDMSDTSLLVLASLMIVGGSPASTAGGMKTVTFVMLLLIAASVVRRREQVEAFNRSLPAELIRRAATVAVCYLGLVLLITLLLTITEARSGFAFMQLLFEAVSGCGTVGLSTGVTAELSNAGKVVVILGMFAGRLGPLTMLFAITMHRRVTRYELPSERVVLG